jgi:hypothetical protein
VKKTAMHTAISNLLPILLVIVLKSTTVVARLLQNEVEQLQVGGEGFGYVSAKALWSNGKGYNCTNIYTHFWVDVKAEVFPDCEDQWIAEYRSVNADQCKFGAERFTKDQIGACFTTTDCTLLGLSASATVAKSFCGGLGLLQQRDFLPARCKEHAEVSCKSDAVNRIQKILDENVCVNVTGSALDHVRPIHVSETIVWGLSVETPQHTYTLYFLFCIFQVLCEVEIDAMETQAQLPY